MHLPSSLTVCYTMPMDQLAEAFDKLREKDSTSLLLRARDKFKAAHLLYEHGYYADAAGLAGVAARLAGRALLILQGGEDSTRDSVLEARLNERRDERALAALAVLGELAALITALESGQELNDPKGETARPLRQVAELLASVQKFSNEIKQAHAARETQQAADRNAQAQKITISYRPAPQAARNLPLTPFTLSGRGTGRKPWYDSVVRCVMCDGVDFMTALPRLKAQQLIYRYADPLFPLLVEETEGAAKGVDPADPLACAAHVCPNCLYASGNQGNFYSESRYDNETGLLHGVNSRRLAKFRELMIAQLAARGRIYEQRLGAHPPARVFAQPRAQEAALTALELSAFCSEAEYEINGNALFAAGKQLLAAAKIASQLCPDEEPRFLARALDCFTRGFERCAQTAESLYLIAVLHARAGNFTEARANIGRLLTDRGEIVAAVRFKGWGTNLNEYIRSQLKA